MKATRPVGYLNVDLDVVSTTSLDLLAAEIGKAVVVLYSGPGAGRRRFLCVESRRWPNAPDSAARDLCRVVERLSPAARGAWDRAQRREFNVGYELPAGVRAVQVTLQPATVRQIVALGATVAFTCYRDDGEPVGPSVPIGPARPRKARKGTNADSRQGPGSKGT